MSAHTKAVMADDGTWLTIEVRLERVGAGIVERPADGSVNLLEAVRRARAHQALAAIQQKCSAAERFGEVAA